MPSTARKSRQEAVGAAASLGLKPIHCSGCGRFLGYHMLIAGVVQILCPDRRCKAWTYLENLPGEVDNAASASYTQGEGR